MPITFDLTAEQSVARNGRSDVLGFAELTNAARRPRELAKLLWGERRDAVVLHQDDVPKSAKQAAAAVLAGMARSRSRRIVNESGDHSVSSPVFFTRAVAELGKAAPRELRDSIRLTRDAERDCGHDYRLPRLTSGHPSRVLYLRGNPTMAWKGQTVGGAATHMTGVVNGMIDNSVDVQVLAPGSLPGLRAEVRPVPLRRIFHFQPWLTQAAYALEVERASEQVEADIIYQRYEPGSLAGLRVAARKDIPLVIEYNGSELWVEQNWSRSGRASRGSEIQQLIEGRILSQASLIVVVSTPLRDQLLERDIPEDRILVNPNGVETDALTSYRARTPQQWRAKGALPEAPTVGFIGTFGLWHGVLELPEMVERVAEARPDARWIMVGDGEYWLAVKAGLDSRNLLDRVTIPGALPRDRALEMLAAADVCVSPHVPNPDGSRFFGSPTKLFEYMGLGKPIVASDLEQIGEVLSDGETGRLHEPGDSEAAAAAIVELLDDPASREQLGRAALAHAEGKYTWIAHAGRILDAVAGSAG